MAKLRLGRALIPLALLWCAGGMWIFPSFEFLFAGGVPDFVSALKDPAFRDALRFTLGQAILSTGISLALGWLCAVQVFESALKRRHSTGWVHAALQFPFVVPSITAASAWIAVLGVRGLALDRPFSAATVIAAHVCFNFPFAAHLFLRALEAQPSERVEVSRVLGFSWRKRWRVTGKPAFRGAWAFAGAQIFALCVTSFSIVLLLGGGPPNESLETLIYAKALFAGDSARAVAPIAWAQLLCVAIPASFAFSRKRPSQEGRERPEPFVGSLGREGVFRRQTALRSSLKNPVAWAWVALACAPLLGLLWAERSGIGAVWDALRDEEARHSLAISLGLAFASASLCAVLAWASASHARFAPWVSALATGPAALSTLVLGSGLLFAYGAWIDPTRGSASLVIAAQAALAWPLGHRMLRPIFQAEHARSREELLRVLGRRPWFGRVRLEWRRVRARVLEVWGLVAAASCGELGAAALFSGEDWMPAPVLILRLLSQYEFEKAAGVAFGLLCASLFYILVARVWVRRWAS